MRRPKNDEDSNRSQVTRCRSSSSSCRCARRLPSIASWTLEKSDLLQGIVAERAAQIRLLIDAEAQGKLYALRRMARRWTAANGTPEDQWRRDAANHVNQLDGVRAVAWVDATYHVRWIEPISGNERAVGLNVAGDPERAAAFKSAVAQDSGMFIAPLDLVQGYRGFIAYSPVHRDGQFNGFLAAVFSINEFFTSVLSPELLNDFGINVRAGGRDLYKHSSRPARQTSPSRKRAPSRSPASSGRCA